MILESIYRPKRYFNDKDKKDIASAKSFFETHSWRHEQGCPFILEYPYLTVPDMIKDKMTHKILGIEFSSNHHLK